VAGAFGRANSGLPRSDSGLRRSDSGAPSWDVVVMAGKWG